MSLFIFMEDGVFSWRKALTCNAAVIFTTACIGYLITHKFDELPTAYWAIIGGVFVFYFGKRMFENLKVTTK